MDENSELSTNGSDGVADSTARPWDDLDNAKPVNLVNLRLGDRHKAMYEYIAKHGGVRSGHSWLHKQCTPLIEEAAEKVFLAVQSGWKPPI